MLDAYVSFNSETVQLQNIITVQLYSKEIFESLIAVEQLGNNLFDEFVKGRMQPETEKSFFDPAKRSSVKTFTSSNKPLKLKVHDKVIELKENCNLFARCALVKDKRNIDMRTVIGEHELTNVPLSLFNPDGSLINGGVGKSSAVDEVLKFANVKPLTQVRHVCYVIDDMAILNKLNPKLSSEETKQSISHYLQRRLNFICEKD